MSIGICDLNMSKARVLGFALLCSASLSACNRNGGEGFSFAPKKADARTGSEEGPVVPKTTETTLARGSVTLKAPKGYCIDETSVTNGLQGSSAMLAKCSSLDGIGAGSDAAVMSVSISPRRGNDAIAPTPTDLAKAAEPRRILQLKEKGKLALVQIGSGGDEVFSAADPVHWRGATMLDTRLVLLGAFAPKGSVLTSNKGADLLASLARGISATRGSLLGRASAPANPDGEAGQANQPKDDPSTPAPESVESEKKGASGLIARLLNRS
ncbi:hypothetical protein [Planktotalea sp.]|uniref:hypothetical protein n=1 Tax=Planktotalea sp. TaxID=2029877 RepID=UPI003D6A3496